MPRLLIIVTALLIGSVPLAGCGSAVHDDDAKANQAIVEARKQGVEMERARQKAIREKERQKALTERIRRLEAQQKRAARQAAEQARRARQAPAPPPAPSRSAYAGTSCGDGLGVGPNTSCAFASEVRSAWYAAGGGSAVVTAYSPVTGSEYVMSCSAGAPTVCRGGNNAVVYIH